MSYRLAFLLIRTVCDHRVYWLMYLLVPLELDTEYMGSVA